MPDYKVEELPAFLRPKLRLFMSVDITGSTQFKQMLSHRSSGSHKDALESDNAVPSEPWLSPILEFYEQISTIFAASWSATSKLCEEEPHEWKPGEEPTVWKAVGDELIFTKTLSDHRQAYVCAIAWLDTVHEYRKRIKIHSSSLDLKCAAWIAGFPVNNAEVILDHRMARGLPTGDDGDYIFGNLARLHEAHEPTAVARGDGIRDFIGPSIDTGFRVASASSPRRFVVSADLAFILAHAVGNLPSNTAVRILDFYYDGRKDLKGVTNGIPYPMFWVNAVEPDPLMEIEDQIENRKPTPARDVKIFCERFLEKNKDTHVMQPFIVGDRDDFFRRIPSRHIEKLKKLAKYWESESNRRVNEETAQLESAVNEALVSDAEMETLSSKLASPSLADIDLASSAPAPDHRTGEAD